MSMINEEIGKRITEARENIGITRKELAEKVGVAASTITRYEKGNIENIKLPVIEAISRALRVNPMWVIGKSECRNVEEMHTEKDSYYTNPETAELAEQLRTNAGLRMLFKASADLDPDKMKEAYNYVQYLKSKEPK
ncbi:helix-turn-helix domain-containing protein [Acidaminococcus intestini]|uniref:helix-turn-helix domain-containing protein n=1 Tax=Acidaminococcus intestini TaxID=187327 RepID=UPI0004087FCE|nr:helix-turn-helix transcriptional regulator [Acidaminococcus intestini]